MTEPNQETSAKSVEAMRERLVDIRFVSPTGRGRPASDPRSEAPSDAGSGYMSVRSSLHARLLNEIERGGMLTASEEDLRAFVTRFVERVLRAGDLPLNEAERRGLAADLLEETLGVGPLAPLMLDPAISDIMVNGPHEVYIERFGNMEKSAIRFRDNEHLVRIIQRIAARVGRRVDESSPMVDARLRDGSRVNATLPPVSIDWPTISIRRFGRLRLNSTDLIRLGMMSAPMFCFLGAAVQARKNLLISGGPGAGKSTLLGAVAESIPGHERIITIEDAAELALDQEHVVRFETRAANTEGKGQVTTRDLMINSLRMRPDRLIIGEVRGPEAADMLQAMNTGHEGGLTTLHANSARDALSRLETMVLMAGLDLPSHAIREQIASAIHIIVHVRRFEDGVRRVVSISEMTGRQAEAFVVKDIFRFQRARGLAGRRQVEGTFVPTGHVPECHREFEDRGLDITTAIYQAPPGGAE